MSVIAMKPHSFRSIALKWLGILQLYSKFRFFCERQMSKYLINKTGVVLSAKWNLMLSCFQCDLISFGFSRSVSKISTEEIGYGKDKSNKCWVLLYMWQEVCLEESQGRVTMHAYSSTPFLLLEQLHSQNQVMRREILQLSCKAQKKEKDT